MSTELTREEVCGDADRRLPAHHGARRRAARDRRVGLRELGLPYETEPAITRHLAAFSRARARHTAAAWRGPTRCCSTAASSLPRSRAHQVLDALAAWFGARPWCSTTRRRKRRWRLARRSTAGCAGIPAAAKRLLIRAGSARSYYIGVGRRLTEGACPAEALAKAGARRGLCVMPRGTAEGTRFDLDRELSVVSNQPAAFTLYSSVGPHGPVDTLVAASGVEGRTAALRQAQDRPERRRRADSGLQVLQRHAPLVTAFRYGKRSRRVPLAVRLSAAFTETGTLEIWCRSEETDHRWRLAFNLRAVEADPLDGLGDEATDGESGVVVDPDAVAAASRARSRRVRGRGRPAAGGVDRGAGDGHRARQARLAAAGDPRARRRSPRNRVRTSRKGRPTKCAG